MRNELIKAYATKTLFCHLNNIDDDELIEQLGVMWYNLTQDERTAANKLITRFIEKF